MRRLALGLVLGTGLSVALPLVALAHPLGNFAVNRYSRLEVDRDRVTLRYVLDLAEIPTLQELQAAGIKGAPDPSERGALLRRFVPQLREGARLTIAGEPAKWTERDSSLELPPGQAGLPTLRVALTLEAQARVADGAMLEYRDTNFAERLGWREVVVRAGPGVQLDGATATSEDASDELRRYPSDPMFAPLAISTASTRVRLATGADPRYGGPEVAAAPRLGVGGLADELESLVRAGSAGDLLATLLSLAAAAGIGAAHAITPGHGKTVMAAYLVGSRGTARQALALGGVVALSHTAGVLGLGLAVLGASTLIAPERFYPYLAALSALVILGIGFWLVLGLLRRRNNDHTHEHGHVHAHDGAHAHHHDTGGRVGWRALAALGVSGGIIPSASALLLLLAAAGLRRPDLGVILVLAFGIGMAVVLAGIGLTLVGAGRLAARHLSDVPAARRVAGLLPAMTAVTVLIVGAGLSLQAVQQMLAVLS